MEEFFFILGWYSCLHWVYCLMYLVTQALQLNLHGFYVFNFTDRPAAASL